MRVVHLVETIDKAKRDVPSVVQIVQLVWLLIVLLLPQLLQPLTRQLLQMMTKKQGDYVYSHNNLHCPIAFVSKNLNQAFFLELFRL